MIDSMRLYGRAMLSYLEGGSGRILIERDDGYKDMNDVRDLFAPYLKWNEGERGAIKYAKGRVLDVGVGAGRVALYLQRRGLDVTGIDSSPESLECAIQRGVKKAVLMDARRLSFPPNSFDTVVLFGNNFGITGDFTATRRLLRSLAGIARPRARLLASTRTPGSWIDHHSKYVMKNVREGRPPGLIKLRMVYKGQTGTWFPLLMVSPDDAMRLCISAGWEVVRVIPCGGGITDFSFVAERRK